jgi:hypothetical protein
MVWSADDFMPTQVVKGDFDGHPFRGNQWSDSSGASTAGGPSGESPDRIQDTWGGMFGGDFDEENGVFLIDEQGINDFLIRQHADLSLTKSEKDSVNTWTSYDYADVNAVMRGQIALESFDAVKRNSIETTIKDLNQILTKATLDQDVTVFRGINDNEQMFDDTSKGDIITDNGFIATSLNPIMAAGAAMGMIEGDDTELQNDLIFRIKIPKGTPAFSAQKLGDKKTLTKPDPDLLALQGHSHGAEIVLPPNTRFKVVGEIWIEQQRTLELEVIPNA